MKQHILVVGSGQSEQAVATRLRLSPRVGKVSVVPGNGSTVNNIPIAATDIEGLVRWAVEHKPDVTVIGSAQALAAGVVDAFKAAGLCVFGPTKAAAQIGSSRVFAKQFMQRHHIPTAPFEVFDTARAAIGYLLTEGDQKLVIRADGLTVDNGVYVTDCAHDAEKAVRDLMVNRVVGEAGARIVIEQCLEGQESTIAAFSDGRHMAIIPGSSADSGSNTGVIQATIDGLRGEGVPFTGILFARLILTPDGSSVVAYNVGLDDPETDIILPLLTMDLVDIFDACLSGTLDKVHSSSTSP